MDCWTSWYTFNNKPSIQTMTIHTIALMTCLLAILKSDDAAVYLKLKAIECTSPDGMAAKAFCFLFESFDCHQLSLLFHLHRVEWSSFFFLTEIFIVAVFGMVITYISILTDLFLLVGIEDNCRMAMSLFTWWNSFCISLQSMLAVGVLTSKVTRENFTVIIRWLLLTIVVLMIKSHYTRQVHAYYQHVKPLNTLQSMIKETVRITASNSEQQNKPGQS
ncbi:uncharacterized protein [Dermacentor albipictus]|uniref:uncharacterized protein isoform X2 n=1 Tax=Dermacentor albipictus TaxID=60249 RepID=UPI0038FC1E4D